MSRKYIKLFEELDVSPTWNTIRDSIQQKKPFLIVVCEDDDSCSDAKKNLNSYTSIDQTAYTTEDGENINFPSFFVVLDNNTKFKDIIKTLFNNYSIKVILKGEKGAEFIVKYYDAKNSQNLGNEVVSDLSPESMPPDDYFKVESTYYKFINFNV